MASLLKKDVILNFAEQAPSPQKDYCQIVVTKKEVIFRWWKITLRQNAKALPGEIKDTYKEFLEDDRCQSEIQRVFGKHMLEYVKLLAEGQIDYLPRLPQDLLLQIIRKTDLEDISRLACTNKMFNQLCNGNELWEQIYHDNSEAPITDDLRSLAEGLGWKRLFFTNKLQLQVQLRRQANKNKGQAFLTQRPHIKSTSCTDSEEDD